MTKATAVFFWQKMDHPGADSCRLIKLSSGGVFWSESVLGTA